MLARVALSVMIGVLVVSAPAAGQTATPKPSCQRGEALLAREYLDEAESVYKELLGRRRPCVARGLEAVAMGREEAADKKMSQAEFAREIGAIRRLQGSGFEEAARARLQKLVVRNFPEKQTLPKDVRSLDERTPSWRRQLGKVVPDLRSIAEIALVVLIAFTALRILFSFLARFRKGIRLTGFDGASDPGLSAGLTGALHDALDRLKETGPRQQVHWVSATEGDFVKMPTTLGATLPHVALASDILATLDRLVPRRVHLVSGTVRAVDSARGAGLTITVRKRHGPIVAEQTVWEGDFDLPIEGEERLAARYAQLVLPATVWLAYHMSPSNTPLNCSDWRSYARFAVAELHHRAGDLEQARLGYEAALDRDTKNLGARLNLASLLLHRPPQLVGPESPEDAERRLTAAEALLDHVVAHGGDPTSAIWYRARMLRATCALYREPAEALKILPGLLRAITWNTESLKRDVALMAFFRTMEYPLLVLAQIVSLKLGKACDELPRIEALDWKSADTLYNLACFYSYRSQIREEAGDKNAAAADRKLALDRLEERLNRARTVRRHELAREWARTDVDFDPIRKEKRFKKLTSAPEAERSVPRRARKAIGERVTTVREAVS